MESDKPRRRAGRISKRQAVQQPDKHLHAAPDSNARVGTAESLPGSASAVKKFMAYLKKILPT